MESVHQQQILIPVGALLEGESDLAIAIDIYIPQVAQLVRPARVVFCQPGGALDKHYYHLVLEDGDVKFSFAQHMAARGIITVAIDHLGIGASSKPLDGFALTPERLIAANARAVEIICEQLRSGQLTQDLPPLPDLVAVGVGHSMGGMLTVMQQSRYRSYAAIAALGFGTSGLMEYLPEAAREFAGDAAGAAANIERLARAQGGDPYPELAISAGRARGIYGGGADKRAVAAMAAARTNLLAVAGLFSMIPGGTLPDCAAIDVPVFIGVGDRDISGPPHLIPANFSTSADVALLVLHDTGHSHFLFDSSALLFERLADFALRS